MIELVIPQRRRDLGSFEVGRVLPYARRRMVGPFIFLDHGGPVVAYGRPRADVRPHPHIGLSTVSYLLSGAITHRDSLGVEQVIRPGDVNWMTAGRGISHSERFEDPSVLEPPGIELLQSWVALPEADEETGPAFDHYPASVLPEARDAGTWMRLIAGEAYGMKSPVKTHSPLFCLHASLRPGARLTMPHGHPERAAYVVAGCVEHAGNDYRTGQMLVFGRSEGAQLEAREASTLMLLGGEPLGERHIWWNFVSSRRERIEQAKADWKSGRIALPPNDAGEFIPLPDDRP